MDLDKHEDFPEHAEDWDRISESFSKASGSVEVIYTGVKKAEVPVDLVRDGNISVGAKALYILYYTFIYDKETFVGRAKLAEHLGVSLRSVSNYTKELEQTGWISVKRGQKKLRVNGNPIEVWSNIVELHDKPRGKK